MKTLSKACIPVIACLLYLKREGLTLELREAEKENHCVDSLFIFNAFRDMLIKNMPDERSLIVEIEAVQVLQ